MNTLFLTYAGHDATETEIDLVDGVDVETVETVTYAAPATLNDMLAQVDQTDVTLCLGLIDRAFIDREAYERSKSADGTVGKAFVNARKVMTGNTQVARLLCALNVDVETVINRSRKGNSRANLYALHKLHSIAQYVTGSSTALDSVSLAYLSSLIIYQRESGADATLDTDGQETALTRAQSFRGLAQHVIDALTDQATRANMKGGKSTQASQCRTMLENIGAIQRVDLHNVRINLEHALTRAIASRMSIAL